MKILENVTTVFDDNLISLIQKYLEEKVRRGEVLWKDAYNLLLKTTADKLTGNLKMDVQPAGGRINRDAILNDFALAKLYMVALELESKNIDRILGTHELLRKDNVRITTDVKRRYLDIVNHSIQEFRTTNIAIKDGKIRLFPLLTQVFTPRDVSATYEPSTYVEKTGNEPTVDNISSGTNAGYWEAKLLTKSQAPASAIIELDFVDTITFNRLKINSSGKFPVTVDDIEVLVNGIYTSVHTGDETSKYINIVYPQTYQTSKVRLTLTQTIGEFLWWTTIDNREGLADDNMREETIDDSVRESVDGLDYTPIVRKKIDNVYEYTLGAYNILFFLDIYSGSDDGIFYSRKFTAEGPIETVRLSDEIVEYKPGSSSISYSIIQQDGSRVPISMGETIALSKLFSKTQTLTNGVANWVELDSAPLESGIVVTVNGETAARVDSYTGRGILEYIISGKKLFFSVPVEGKSVSTVYNHKTDYFVVQITMNNNTNENQFDTPSIENFEVEVNGEA
jgi:hypothetical protein